MVSLGSVFWGQTPSTLTSAAAGAVRVLSLNVKVLEFLFIVAISVFDEMEGGFSKGELGYRVPSRG